MQIKLFNVPISDTGSSLEEMNGFLRNNKVLDVGQEFVQSDRGSIWCFCVRYIDGALPSKSTTGSSAKAKVDYKEVLDDATFCVFSKLRVCRKLIAEACPFIHSFVEIEIVIINIKISI